MRHAFFGKSKKPIEIFLGRSSKVKPQDDDLELNNYIDIKTDDTYVLAAKDDKYMIHLR